MPKTLLLKHHKMLNTKLVSLPPYYYSFRNFNIPKIEFMTPKEKIASLRAEMKKNKVDAFIVYAADPHMSEYLPAEWQERTWLSGFTGSAGFVVVT